MREVAGTRVYDERKEESKQILKETGLNNLTSGEEEDCFINGGRDGVLYWLKYGRGIASFMSVNSIN